MKEALETVMEKTNTQQEEGTCNQGERSYYCHVQEETYAGMVEQDAVKGRGS